MLDDELNNGNDTLNIGDDLRTETTKKQTKKNNKSDTVDKSAFDTFNDTLAINSEPEIDDEPVTVQPVQFASFDASTQTQGQENQNLELLMDVKLQLTVELGRCELPIKKVLELTKGSIVTLNKAAGEPVELYANGKLIAYGEVVVIEDNFGLRITHITDPARRLNSLGSTSSKDEVQA